MKRTFLWCFLLAKPFYYFGENLFPCVERPDGQHTHTHTHTHTFITLERICFLVLKAQMAKTPTHTHTLPPNSPP